MDTIVEEYRNKNSKKISGFMEKLSTSHIIVLGILFFFLLAINKSQTLDSRYSYIVYFVLIGIIAVLYFRPGKEKTLIDEDTAKKIAQKALNQKVKDGKEFPFDSKVSVSKFCHLKYENDLISGTSGPVGWDVGFVENVHGTQYKKEGVIRIHPFEGIVTGIVEYGTGYTGRESKDVTIVPVGLVQGNMKTTDYGNPNPKGS